METCFECGKPAQFQNDQGVWYCRWCVAPHIDVTPYILWSFVCKDIDADADEALKRNSAIFERLSMEPDGRKRVSVMARWLGDTPGKSFYELLDGVVISHHARPGSKGYYRYYLSVEAGFEHATLPTQ